MDNRVCYRVCYRVASRHQDIVVYLKSPRRRRENFLFTKRIAQDIVVYLKSPRRRREFFLILQTYRARSHRIRALNLVRGECTTNVQSQESQNPGSEPSAGQSVYWRNTISRARKGRQGRAEEERRRRKEGGAGKVEKTEPHTRGEEKTYSEINFFILGPGIRILDLSSRFRGGNFT